VLSEDTQREREKARLTGISRSIIAIAHHYHLLLEPFVRPVALPVGGDGKVS